MLCFTLSCLYPSLVCSFTFYIKQFGYEDTFYNSFGGDTSSVDSYIDQIVTHLQAFYCLDSLGTKVEIQVGLKQRAIFDFTNNFFYHENTYLIKLTNFIHNRNLKVTLIIVDIPGKLIQMLIPLLKSDQLLLPVMLMPIYGL